MQVWWSIRITTDYTSSLFSMGIDIRNMSNTCSSPVFFLKIIIDFIKEIIIIIVKRCSINVIIPQTCHLSRKLFLCWVVDYYYWFNSLTLYEYNQTDQPLSSLITDLDPLSFWFLMENFHPDEILLSRAPRKEFKF